MRFLSLFSGIEAASVAFAPLGWHAAGFSEIEPFACKFLAQRYPDVPNLGDITKITEQQIKALGRIDIVVFGSPCQDLSLAGQRKGFDGARSSLFFTAIRIIRWARIHCGCRFALWENVFGAFSSNAGRDFAAVVGEMAGIECVEVPANGWGGEGAAVGKLGLLEWSVLDAQWFGVAARRRRCFALADFGDWSNRPPILLEPQSMRGNPAQISPAYPTIDCGIWRKRQCNQWVRNGFAIVRNGRVSNPTITEVERMLGFPDGYTAINNDPQGRYKALGNSWAVPVVRWIGSRIDRAAMAATKEKKQ